METLPATGINTESCLSIYVRYRETSCFFPPWLLKITQWRSSHLQHCLKTSSWVVFSKGASYFDGWSRWYWKQTPVMLNSALHCKFWRRLTNTKGHNLFHTQTSLCFTTYPMLQKCWVDENAKSNFCTLNCILYYQFSYRMNLVSHNFSKQCTCVLWCISTWNTGWSLKCLVLLLKMHLFALARAQRHREKMQYLLFKK